MAQNPLLALRNSVGRRGITSVCSSHPIVIEAALLEGLERTGFVLIEATCNQVNHRGGYTGMTPRAFRSFVETIADKVGFPRDRLILGGDHLGPNPWKHLPAEAAMAEAETMIAAYAEAGFTKLHLDTSMGCLGEPAALDDTLTASRAARLAARAEAEVGAGALPVYIVGTEVPVPGGATHALDHLEVTRPEGALRTVEVHREAFAALGLSSAFERVIGLVVQPGVEFGDDAVIPYDRPAAQQLTASLAQMPGLVFEAHSTDYQTADALAALVEDGFAILKVGPGLTFALRQALYGLDHIALAMGWVSEEQSLRMTMERLMLDKPDDWQKYYSAEPRQARVQRHFSYSDRIRYYWPNTVAEAAVERLLAGFGDAPIPGPLHSQYLGSIVDSENASARQLVLKAVRQALEPYSRAIN